MRFNRFLHLIAFSGKAHGDPPASGLDTTKMPDAPAPSQATAKANFSRYLPLSGGGTRLFYAAVRRGPRRYRRNDGRGRPSVRRLRCVAQSVERHMNASGPTLPGDSPGNVAAPVRRFHLQHGVAGNREKERASRVSYQGPERPAGPDLQGPPHSAISFSTFFMFQAHPEISK